MTRITITRHEDNEGGRYEASVDGRDGRGELTYSRSSGKRIIADHTGVDDSLRGTGVGKALVKTMVDDARRDGVTVEPLCSFVAALARKHPEWSDVIHTQRHE
ncbi:MAG: GNAT family N-acetyltransferase [Pseudomonadota bacterium]